jgi:hypothetical protein
MAADLEMADYDNPYLAVVSMFQLCVLYVATVSLLSPVARFPLVCDPGPGTTASTCRLYAGYAFSSSGLPVLPPCCQLYSFTNERG